MERLTPFAGMRKSQRSTWNHWRYRMVAAGWAAGLLLTFFAGSFVYQLLSGSREPGDRELVRELRLIENKRLYEIGESLEFLRQLDHPEYFGDDSGS
jgi:hypothetical protein